MSSINPPTGWNLTLDEFDSNGEATLEKKSEGIKVHCNDKGDSYLLTAIHMLDGLIDERNMDYNSDINSEVNEFIEEIESNYQ